MQVRTAVGPSSRRPPGTHDAPSARGAAAAGSSTVRTVVSGATHGGRGYPSVWRNGDCVRGGRGRSTRRIGGPSNGRSPWVDRRWFSARDGGRGGSGTPGPRNVGIAQAVRPGRSPSAARTSRRCTAVRRLGPFAGDLVKDTASPSKRSKRACVRCDRIRPTLTPFVRGSPPRDPTVGLR